MRWPLVGRERELGSATSLLAASDRGGIVVVGAAGVGKTRLATEVAAAAQAQGHVVEWARATRSSASIPLGAFAGLLPPVRDAGAELLARARRELAARAGGRRLVLCVDDAQLLDDASAALVHQVVAAGEAFAVVTIRSGTPVPDAVRALWKDDLCAFAELRDLTADEVSDLLVAVLGGPVDGRTHHALFRRTRGNPLFLRELLRAGLETGKLAAEGGIWRWAGEPGAAGLRLVEVVEARLERLSPEARAALELVAAGGPFEVGLLDEDERVAVDALEADELVERWTDGRRRYAGLVHPVHGDVVLARLGGALLEEVHRHVAGRLAAGGLRRRGDVLRLVTAALEAGETPPAALCEQAAERALVAMDARLAERCARAAGTGFGASLLLGRALAAQGRAREADALFTELRPSDDAERAALAIAIARNAFWALDAGDEALAVLERAERAIGDDAVREEVTASRLRLMSAAGCPRDALAAALPMLDEPDVGDAARVHAAVAAGEALLTQGRHEAAAALVDRWLPLAREVQDVLPLNALILESIKAISFRWAGRLDEATALATATYTRAVATGSAQNTAVEAVALGYLWLARGQVERALRLFHEAAALLRDADAVGMRSWALAGLTQAAAQAGDAALARAAVTEMDAAPLGHQGFACELGLARAWAAAAEGELSRALPEARAAAQLTRTRHQHAFELRVLHEMCRLGDHAAVAGRLAELAESVDGPFVDVAAAHAAALVAADGAALDEVADRFAGLGALLLAAEAAGAAASAHREQGLEARARASAARSRAWLDRCAGARPPSPALALAPEAEVLTAREREIALLAAGGLTSREIADRLVVSVRTVDNHLARAYRKLGAAGRQDLGTLLSVAAAPD